MHSAFHWRGFFAVGALSFAITSQAWAKRAPGSYLHANPDRVDIVSPKNPLSHSSNIIFLNGCFGTGCDITPGNESSVNNTSSIVSSASHIPPFTGGEVEWQAIVNCVRDTYAPFDIVITDQDPSPANHFEAIVAGEPQDIGMPQGAGGVAPYICGSVINNAITYTFASFINNDIAETCWTVAQETAHAFGLDHEFLCADPMSYLQSCDPNKRFQNQEAQCGELQPRACSCNGSTQNSFRSLLDHFGAGIPTPPNVQITSPGNGEQVEPGFIVRVHASDDRAIDRVELRINNTPIGESASEPYIFNVPETISDGRMILAVTAVDTYEYATTEVIEVVQGEPCRKSSSCGEFEACVQGRCVPGPDLEGGLGQSCTSHSMCLSGKCGQSSDASFCTETCDKSGDCPSGFGCLDTADTSVCWPGYDDSGGCSVGTGVTSWSWVLALALLAARRRRR